MSNFYWKTFLQLSRAFIITDANLRQMASSSASHFNVRAYYYFLASRGDAAHHYEDVFAHFYFGVFIHVIFIWSLFCFKLPSFHYICNLITRPYLNGFFHFLVANRFTTIPAHIICIFKYSCKGFNASIC